MHRSVILPTVIVLTNLLLAALVYGSVGWHFVRGYNEVVNFMVVPAIAGLAGLNLLIAAVILVVRPWHQAHWGRQVLKYLTVCGALVALSPLFAPTLGRMANHSRWIYTPLVQAARYGDATLVITLLEDGADPNVRQPSLGRTALHYMAYRGEIEAVEALLTNGADPNARTDTSLETPLHWAVRSRADATVIKLLISHGADPALRDWKEQSSLDYTRTIPEPTRTEIIDALR